MQVLGDQLHCLRCGHALGYRLLDGVQRQVCPECDWVHYEDPKVATGCLIFNELDEVLLVCRSIDPVGRWVFPGGFVDRFEDPDVSACREVKEETGLEVQVDSLLGIYRAPKSPVLVLVYLAEVLAGSPPPQALHECSDLGYFSQGSVPWDMLAFSVTEWALKDGFRVRNILP